MSGFRTTNIGAALAACMCVGAAAPALANTGSQCRDFRFGPASYTACRFEVESSQIRLFHSSPSGSPYRQFDALDAELALKGERLVFGMNAGMYHANRQPVGLFIEAGVIQVPINMADGHGNFFLKPNGVFYIEGDRAGVVETTAFAAGRLSPRYATQSGPLLLLGGKVHAAFNATSTSRARRNGVGITDGGRVVTFAISNGAVTLYEFATMFRDAIGVRDALYLDGSISRLYAPDLGRFDAGGDIGPIVGVVAVSPRSQ